MDFTFLDGELPFEKIMTSENEVILVQMPRSILQSRHPNISHHMAERFDAGVASNAMICRFIANVDNTAAHLDTAQRKGVLLALIELLATGRAEGSPTTGLTQQVRRALGVIEAGFCRQNFDAAYVANEVGLSRRRLDELFLKAVGRSISAQIWERRLTRAALELRSSSKAPRSVTEIALSMGFEDSAHFSRAFKKRFQVSPSEWRAREP